jgi:hypothetical protein
MASGIMVRINGIKKLSQKEKQELKEECKRHSHTISDFLENNRDIPYVVMIALEDRICTLNNTYLKI